MSESATAIAPMPIQRFLAGAGLSLLLTVASGVLAGLAFAPLEWWPLAWVGLAPLFIALRRTTTVRFGGYLMLLFGLVFCTVSLNWLSNIFRAPGLGSVMVIGIFLIVALPWVLFGLAYRFLAPRLHPTVFIWAVPILWVAVEWLRCEGWYFRFSWAQLGFTIVPWVDARSLLYPLVGVYGVTFLIVLTNAALAWAWMNKRKAVLRTIITLLILCHLPFLIKYAVFRLTATNNPTAEADWFRFAEASHRWPGDREGIIVQHEEGNVTELARASELAVGSAGPRNTLVVWPELAIAANLDEYPQQLDEVRALAKQMGTTLVFGCKTNAPANAPVDPLRRRNMELMEGHLFYNTALVIGPDGNMLGAYHKTHPIPFFSDGVPGQRFDPIPTPAGRLGVAICFDFDFAGTPLRLVHRGAEVLVVPTYDAIDWSDIQHRQHSRMAQARAAEVGRWTLRATSSGLSQIIRPDGTLAAYIPFDTITQSAHATFTPRRTPTAYSAFTWLLPYLCLVLSALWLLAESILATRRRESSPFTEVNS